MKSSKKIFEGYIDKATREWWEQLPKCDTHPFHATEIPWQLIPEDAKWTMYGLYVDQLRGISFFKDHSSEVK